MTAERRTFDDVKRLIRCRGGATFDVLLAVVVGLAAGAFLQQRMDQSRIRQSAIDQRNEFRTPGDGATTSWIGVPIWKFPADSFRFQEIIVETRPDVIVETGTYKGGSAYYYATLFDLLGNGRIITVDIAESPEHPIHDRITYLLGSSTEPAMLEQIKSLIKPGERVMVTLDSDHSTNHVREELRLYSPLVTVGNYLVVEDTAGSILGMPVGQPGGPMVALEDFLQSTTDFERVPDDRLEFSVTGNTNGWLRRVR